MALAHRTVEDPPDVPLVDVEHIAVRIAGVHMTAPGAGPAVELVGPLGRVSIRQRDKDTELRAENEADDLDDLIDLVATMTEAMDRKAGHPDIKGLTIKITIRTDRHPPGWPGAVRMSHRREFRTETGINLTGKTTSSRRLDLEARDGVARWSLKVSAAAQVDRLPGADELDVLIKTAYTEGCLALMPELHNAGSAPEPMPIAAHEIGPYGDVAAAELEKAAQIAERFDMRTESLGAVAAVMALSGCMGNAERIRPQLDKVEYALPSLAGPAALRIDDIMARLDQDTEAVPEDDRNDPAWTDRNTSITMAMAHTMSLAAQRHAIRRCAARMSDPSLPGYIRRVYRDIAERIINVSTHHLDSTVGELELENEIATLSPETARLLDETLDEAGTDAMTEFHQACQSLDAATSKSGGTG